ncbi:PP2C family protein-serine/threonine phosphatase [Prochlorothrix hollandica]|uniref:PP2C family protein-serine/threonine phosphatase n=1 Tax=Prochlorothrix hollandica TaxID=1223 RepID=UPI00034B289B|nr:PP2C family protein-serine/threonine phosphatase [Prochlorothrix hollandica]
MPKILFPTLKLRNVRLGGDFFDYHWLDENRLRLYLMDAAGHGLRAALFSVSVQNFIKSFSLANQTVDLCDPSQVLQLVNDSFQMADHHDQYVTLWYGIFDRRTQQLTYSSAGHPPAILISPQVYQQLPATGIPIGVLKTTPFPSQTYTVRPGSSLNIFSDGIYELVNLSANANEREQGVGDTGAIAAVTDPDPSSDPSASNSDGGNWPEVPVEPGSAPKIYGLSRFLDLLHIFDTKSNTPLTWLPQEVLHQTGQQHFPDDCSLVQVQFDSWL